jgi:hypothetical protein
LLQTLNFCNANMAHPSPTIYGWSGSRNQQLWPSCFTCFIVLGQIRS